MDASKQELLQKYIDLIRKGLNAPEPNYIAVQVVIDNFIYNALSEKFRKEWQDLYEKKVTVKYVSDQEYRQQLTVFLSRVEFSMPLLNNENQSPSNMSAEKLQELVINHEAYLVKIKKASEENSEWKIKWQTRLREQMAKARQLAIYTIKDSPEIDQEVTKLPQDNQNQVADYIVSQAQEIIKEPVVNVEKTRLTLTERITQQKLIQLGLPASLSGSELANIVIALAQQHQDELMLIPLVEKIQNEEKINSFSDHYVQTQFSIIYHPDFKDDVAKLSFTNQEKLSAILANYHDALKNYGSGRSIYLKSLFRERILSLQIPNLPKSIIDKLFAPQSPFGWLSQSEKLFNKLGISVRPSDYGSPISVRGAGITIPQIGFRFSGFSFPRISFPGLGSFGNATTSFFNKSLGGIFNFGSRASSMAQSARAGVGALSSIGKAAISPWNKYKWLVIGIIIFIFTTGMIGLPTNSSTLYTTESAAFNNPNTPWSEAAQLPTATDQESGSLPPYTGPVGPVDILGCPVNGGAGYNNPPFQPPTHMIINAWDIWPGRGASVYAPEAGTVTGFKTTAKPNQCDNKNRIINYGNYVILAIREGGKPDGKITSYLWFGHFLDLSEKITTGGNGTFLEAGDFIGRVDTTGCSDGDHLHYEHRAADGSIDKTVFFDPVKCNYKKR